MLAITIPDTEYLDEQTYEFFTIKGQTLRLEHSLVSLSKWESKWCKPFLSKDDKTSEETLDYIKCMTLNHDVNPQVYLGITREQIREIDDYISAPMTATTFRKENQRPNREIVTSEVIYYWMFSMNIPIDCEKWHLTRLLTLIKVISLKNSPKKKMSQRAIMSNNAALNAARRKQFHTKG